MTFSFDEFASLLPEALLLATGNGEVLAANRGAAEFFGRPAIELAGQDLTTLFLDGKQPILALLKACSRSKQFVPGGLTSASAGGAPIACRCEGVLYRARTESLPAIVLLRLTSKEAAINRFVLLNQRIADLSIEVNRRRTAEKTLQALTERLRVTLSSIGDAVIATDPDGLVTFMNPVAERLTGYDSAEAIGQHLDRVFAIVNEETRHQVESPVRKVLREGHVVGLANHTLLLRRDGTEIPIDDSGAPIHDDAGSLVGVVLVFHDISQRHELERELLTKTRRLEEADRRKDEFLSMLAHELRNPLAPLRTGLHLLAHKYGSTPEVASVSTMMERQVSHMARLVDDLLDVARLTRGAMGLHKQNISIGEVLEQAIEMSRPTLEAHNVKLWVDSVPRHVSVHGDATRLVQVFSNLLANSAKFTPAGGSVYIETQTTSAEILIKVRDTGQGIKPELVERVFDLFVQDDTSLDRRRGGLGIGLTIVKSIVEMHGGSIEVRSGGIDLGSEFLLRLPLLPAPSAQINSAGLANRHAASLRILVVDDNIDAAEILSLVLRGWGHVVEVRHTPYEALKLLESFTPEAALLDIGLPEMSGFELAKAVRNKLSNAEPLLLVAVTGYGDPSSRRLSKEAGFDHHLAKPVDLDALETVLSRYGLQLQESKRRGLPSVE